MFPTRDIGHGVPEHVPELFLTWFEWFPSLTSEAIFCDLMVLDVGEQGTTPSSQDEMSYCSLQP